jgi:L-fuculose-phosphate aldolase
MTNRMGYHRLSSRQLATYCLFETQQTKIRMNIREDIVRYYRWLRRYGYNDSHSGNASVRDGDAIWVTPTGACADTLIAGELIACDVDGRCAEGASLDAPLHVRIYQRNPQASAVLHSHGPYSVALTLNGEDFWPVDFEGQLYFPKVPVITIPYKDYLCQSPARVAEALAEYPIVIVRGHGVYACSTNINLAYKWTCSLEQSAKTAFIARQAGTLTNT